MLLCTRSLRVMLVHNYKRDFKIYAESIVSEYTDTSVMYQITTYNQLLTVDDLSCVATFVL